MNVLSTTSSFGDYDKALLAKIEKQGLSLIKNPFKRTLTSYELLELVKEHRPIGLLAGLEKISPEIIEYSSSFLKVISRVGVGWDNVDRNCAHDHGIKVFRTEDAVTPAVAELTVGLFFSLARSLTLQDQQIKKGIWNKKMGQLIAGKTFGVVGCGRIGMKTAQLMSRLGCKVLGYDPYLPPEHFNFSQSSIERVESLNDVFTQCDLISLHCSYEEKFKNMVDKKLLSLARANLLLVNVSRGELIDEEALYESLKNSQIAGAALDVFHKEPYAGPLTSLENIILTPHVGSYAYETRIKMEDEAINNLLKGLSGE